MLRPILCPILRVLIACVVLCSAHLCRGETPVFSWVRTAGGATNDQAKFVATDPAGNVFVTGYFNAAAGFGTTNLTSAGNLNAFLAKYTSTGVLAWLRQISTAGDSVGYGLATDPGGNIYLSGNFTGTATFGTTNLISSGGRDMFLAKFNPAGTVMWATRAGGANDDVGLHVVADASGNTVVTGYFRNQSSFGNTNLNSGSSNYSDAFIAKYDASGQLAWVRQIGGSTFDSGYATVLDGVGNIYATGYFNSSASFGTTNLSGTGDEIYVAKYDNSGTLIWARSAGGPGIDKGSSIALDSQGNAYVTGWFTNTISMAGTNLTSRGGYDAFVARYGPAGTLSWVRQIGGAGNELGQSIVVDAMGLVWVSGDFQGTVDFDGTILTAANTNAGYSGMFVARYDSNGTPGGAKQFGVTTSNHAHLWAGYRGELYVAGNFVESASFDSHLFESAGSSDIFVGELVVPPRLSFSRSGSNLVLYWPTNRADFQMERATSLPGSSNSWSSVPVSVFGNYFIIGDSMTEPSAFYRLRRQPGQIIPDITPW